MPTFAFHSFGFMFKFRPFLSLFSAFGVIGLASFAASSSLLLLLRNNSELITDAAPLTMLMYFALVSVTMAFALTPTTYVAIITGHFFGWAGFPPLVLAYLLASALSISVFRKFSKGFARYLHEDEDRFKGIIQGLENREFMLILMLRLSPVFPFAIMNYLLSTLRLRWKDYLLASLFGMLPRTLIFFVAGMHASDLFAYLKHPTIEGTWQLLPIGLIIISMVGIGRIVQKSMHKARKDQSL